MFRILFGLIEGLLDVYKLLIIAYCVIGFLNISANKWTELLRSVVQPALEVTRKLMDRFLPFLQVKGIDLAPVVLFVALHVISWLLGWIV